MVREKRPAGEARGQLGEVKGIKDLCDEGQEAAKRPPEQVTLQERHGYVGQMIVASTRDSVAVMVACSRIDGCSRSVESC